MTPPHRGLELLTESEREIVADSFSEAAVDLGGAADALRLADVAGTREFLDCCGLHLGLAASVVKNAEARALKPAEAE